jgi:rRNA small subunit aminocarboxypropyltransferase
MTTTKRIDNSIRALLFRQIQLKFVDAHILMLHQDDPKKCTADKLVRLGMARQVRALRNNMLVLNPFSNYVLHKDDIGFADSVRSICVIDCSWNKADKLLRLPEYLQTGCVRRIPALLAGNPINYSKIGRLSTVEALAGCYYIIGLKQFAAELLNKFKWGHTFLELNLNPLEDYCKAKDKEEIMQLETEYFGTYDKRIV